MPSIKKESYAYCWPHQSRTQTQVNEHLKEEINHQWSFYN